MKINSALLIFALAFTILMSCDEPPQKTNEKIDNTAEGLKDLIDVFSEKSKEVVNDKELQEKLKSVITEIETEGKELATQLESIINDKEGDWKQKIEALTNDPKFKEELEKLKKDGKGIEEILKDIGESISEESSSK